MQLPEQPEQPPVAPPVQLVQPPVLVELPVQLLHEAPVELPVQLEHELLVELPVQLEQLTAVALPVQLVQPRPSTYSFSFSSVSLPSSVPPQPAVTMTPPNRQTVPMPPRWPTKSRRVISVLGFLV